MADESVKTDKSNSTPTPTLQGVQVGDKVYGPQEVEAMIIQQNAVKAELEQLAVVKETVAKYGIDPQTFVANAEGAFSVMSRLIDEGIIDQQGKVVEKGSKSEVSSITSPTPSVSSIPNPALNALASVDALNARIQKMEQILESVDKTQASLIRSNLEKEIRSKHPVLDQDDMSRIVTIALKDRTKSIFDHAQDIATMKEKQKLQLRAEHAKEFGIDLNTFDENKLLEPTAGGGAGVLFKDKKFSFKKIDDPNAITPFQAAKRLLSLRLGGGN